MRGISLGGREFNLTSFSKYRWLSSIRVLHLAASTMTQTGYTFFSILLRTPHVSVNLQDYESGYTALHRAMFVGNIKAARDLLARNDVDASIKDAEGLTAFDLYNGTVDEVSLALFNGSLANGR